LPWNFHTAFSVWGFAPWICFESDWSQYWAANQYWTTKRCKRSTTQDRREAGLDPPWRYASWLTSRSEKEIWTNSPRWSQQTLRRVQKCQERRISETFAWYFPA
jgi:hypothetical protein